MLVVYGTRNASFRGASLRASDSDRNGSSPDLLAPMVDAEVDASSGDVNDILDRTGGSVSFRYHVLFCALCRLKFCKLEARDSTRFLFFRENS